MTPPRRHRLIDRNPLGTHRQRFTRRRIQLVGTTQTLISKVQNRCSCVPTSAFHRYYWEYTPGVEQLPPQQEERFLCQLGGPLGMAVSALHVYEE